MIDVTPFFTGHQKVTQQAKTDARKVERKGKAITHKQGRRNADTIAASMAQDRINASGGKNAHENAASIIAAGAELAQSAPADFIAGTAGIVSATFGFAKALVGGEWLQGSVDEGARSGAETIASTQKLLTGNTAAEKATEEYNNNYADAKEKYHLTDAQANLYAVQTGSSYLPDARKDELMDRAENAVLEENQRAFTTYTHHRDDDGVDHIQSHFDSEKYQNANIGIIETIKAAGNGEEGMGLSTVNEWNKGMGTTGGTDGDATLSYQSKPEPYAPKPITDGVPLDVYAGVSPTPQAKQGGDGGNPAQQNVDSVSPTPQQT